MLDSFSNLGKMGTQRRKAVSSETNNTEQDEMTTKSNMLTIWSARYSVAKGTHFVAERKTPETDAQAWLKIFREDEPNVLFLACKNKPKT